MKNFNEDLQKLRKLRKSLVGKEKKLISKRDCEIDTERTNILKKYEPQLEKISSNISDNQNEIKELEAKIASYSVFDVSLITEILKDIIKVYTGENFYYKEVDYCPNPKRQIICERVKVLVSLKGLKYIGHRAYESRLHSLAKNGDGIILNWKVTKANAEYINFYAINENGQLEPNIKLNMFPYVKSFIDFVISYSIENNLNKELTEEELEKLKSTFIFNNEESIKSYHQEIESKEEQESKKEISERSEYRAKQLLKALKKIDNGGNL